MARLWRLVSPLFLAARHIVQTLSSAPRIIAATVTLTSKFTVAKYCSCAGGGFEEEDDNDSHYSRDSRSLDTTDEAPNLANNVRIKSKRFLRDYEVEDDVGTSLSQSACLCVCLLRVFESTFYNAWII